jgi:ATP-binding cassette, subfamily F, member 3
MITLSNIEMDLGTRVLFKGVNFLVQRGDRIGLVGRNGAGKTTLLGIISGERRATAGTIGKERGISIGLLSQDLTLDTSLTLRETAEQAFQHVLALHRLLDELQHQVETRTDYESDDYMQLLQKLTDTHDEFALRGGLTMHADIERVMIGLGFEQHDLAKPLTMFSGGWQMRAELGRLLLQNHDVLLLDEPTNHLDIESIQWLEEFLKEREGAVILVSHDRTFLDNVTNRTIEISKNKVYDMNCAYSTYEEIRAERLEQQKAAFAQQQREKQRVQKFIDRFRYKASLASRAQSRIKQLQKMEDISVDEDDGAGMQFAFPPAPRSGRVVVECQNVQKSYGEKRVLKGVDFALERGEKVAFIGKNGEGKSTLSKLIGGLEPSTGGTITIGYNTTLGYYAQHQAEMLGGQNTVYEVMEQASPPEMRPRLRSLLGAFLFSGDDVNKKIAVLSGGEKSRVALARLLLQPTNLLILDEPTNHLDMLSKEVLKQALMKYDGAMIVVSHDRDFLDGLTDKCLAFRGGEITEHLGDIDDFLRELANKPQTANNQTVQQPTTPSHGTPKNGSASNSANEKQPSKPNRFKLQKMLEDVERNIAETERTIQEREQELLDPAVYRNSKVQHAATVALSDAQAKLNYLMSKWQEYSEQLESLS